MEEISRVYQNFDDKLEFFTTKRYSAGMSVFHPQPGQIEFQKDGVPVSKTFEDVYFSVEGGLQESEYVFIKGNALPDRWQGRSRFTIGEIGFGTGLNFLLTRKRWKESQNNAWLHYVSCEAYPLTIEDLRKTLKRWGGEGLDECFLLENWPERVHGFHHFEDSKNRIRLTLFLGDALEMVQNLWGYAVDAWYFDGFSPQKNPELWTDALFQGIAQASAPDATFSTFSAAGAVRRALERSGFEIQKQKGFGKKREMIRGKLKHASSRSLFSPWYALPSSLTPSEVTILGGGLSGCALAYAFARRGVRVHLIERHSGPAQETSGNEAGIFVPTLTAQWNALSQFSTHSFFSFLKTLPKLSLKRISHCGVFQMACTPELMQRQEQLISKMNPDPRFFQKWNSQKGSEVLDLPIQHPGVYFPQGGWVSPAELCSAYLFSDGIRMTFDEEVTELQRVDDRWIVKNASGKILSSSAVLILAHARGAKLLPQTSALPMRLLKGQILAAQTSQSPRSIVTHEGYLIPDGNRVWIGATHEREFKDEKISPEATELLMKTAQQQFPEISFERIPNSERAGIRTMSPDSLPFVGPAPDFDFYEKTYETLHLGKQEEYYPQGRYHEGLYLSLAPGSKGILSSHLAAEILVAQVLGEPIPVSAEFGPRLHPARFLIRQKKRHPRFRKNY